MKCLVSGATGFVGRHLCQQLAARGDTVLPLSRSGAPLPDGTPTYALDLARSGVSDTLLQGADVVFHLAAIAHQRAPREAYRRLNYEAVPALARRAETAGVGCFVFLSSVKAMGPSVGQAPRAESDWSPAQEPYGEFKWRAEEALRQEFADSRMAVIILRPALVYGDKVRGNLGRLAAGVRRGLPRPPRDGGRSMVSVEDLVELMCLLGRQPPAGINTWIVSDGESYSTREIYDLLRSAQGRGPGGDWLPRWAWRLGSWLIDHTVSRGGEKTWDKLFGSEYYSNQALVRATGWQPSRRLQDSIHAVMACGEDER